MADKICYGCDNEVNYLFKDGRCKQCTRMTIEEVVGDTAVSKLDNMIDQDKKLSAQLVIETYDDYDTKAEEIAEKKGCTVFYPADNQLTIDIDSDEQWIYFLRRYNELCQMVPFDMEMVEIPSKSGLPHRHIVITSGESFSEAKRIAIQFALGSDPIRETMNMWRHLRGVNRPTRFFQPKEA